MQLFCKTNALKSQNSCCPTARIRSHETGGITNGHDPLSPTRGSLTPPRGFVPSAFCSAIFPKFRFRFLLSHGKPDILTFFLGHISIVLLLLSLPCTQSRAFQGCVPTLSIRQLHPSLLTRTYRAATDSLPRTLYLFFFLKGFSVCSSVMH